jgi:phospholipid/cholesterol/gamma-HCH transport system ATP-binding protein
MSSTSENKNKKEPLLCVKDLSKSFGDLLVLDHFNLDLKYNQNVVVLGKSGSGKSVLIKCIIGLLKPDSGSINVLGNEIPKMTEDELDKIRVRIGFLFQSNALYDSMTVRENLEFPLRRHNVNHDNAPVEEIVKQALNDVGLIHTIDMMPEELSGGMRKRIALARTLILKPEIILYDEPTTGLDPITSREIIGLMNNIKTKYGTSALVISHDMNCIKHASDLVALLWEGKCHVIDTFSNLLYSKDPIVMKFFES